MSLPARVVANPERAPQRERPPGVPAGRRPQPPADPSRGTPRDRAPRQATPSPPVAARPRSRKRRGVHFGFVGFAAVIVAALVVGIVALNAMLAQAGIGMSQLHGQIEDLSTRRVALTAEAARLSAPGRIAGWAAGESFRQPDAGRVVIITHAGRA